ncbi:MAG: hypothetical protein K2N06_11405 [Oscillospiraceae bacterium]|nr:hypothetical protein [Oscillospiraceae bacterium]
MDIFTVSLFGHRQITKPLDIEAALVKEVSLLIRTKEYVEFLIGRNGEFDLLAASLIRQTQKKIDFGNSALVLVLPSATKNTADLERYYDEVEIFGEDCHFKAALQARNRIMVDRSDLVICCIEHQSGGAYQTVKYAKNQHKTIINLAEGK